jgi:hypothetical protein
MDKINIDLPPDELGIPSNLTVEQVEREREKFLTNQIINYLYFECSNIDLYSTNELERIISFSGFNKSKTLSLIENYTKEEIMKMIEVYSIHHSSDALQKARSENLNNMSHQIAQIKKKEVFYVYMRKFLNHANNNYNKMHLSEDKESTIKENMLNVKEIGFQKAWNFLNASVNLIDLKDLLNAYDHHKLINKAKTIVKDKDNKKLNDYFEKYQESREKKFREVFRANFEDNDLKFLEGDKLAEQEMQRKLKKNLMNNITEGLLKSDLSKFSNLFHAQNHDLIRSNILHFLDIFSLGKLSMVNKSYREYVIKKFPLELTAKNY